MLLATMPLAGITHVLHARGMEVSVLRADNVPDGCHVLRLGSQTHRDMISYCPDSFISICLAPTNCTSFFLCDLLSFVPHTHMFVLFRVLCILPGQILVLLHAWLSSVPPAFFFRLKRLEKD